MSGKSSRNCPPHVSGCVFIGDHVSRAGRFFLPVPLPPAVDRVVDVGEQARVQSVAALAVIAADEEGAEGEPEGEAGDGVEGALGEAGVAPRFEVEDRPDAGEDLAQGVEVADRLQTPGRASIGTVPAEARPR